MVVQPNLKTDTICFPFSTVKMTIVLKSHVFFFATLHRKGAVDDVGAIAKKMVSLAVIQRSSIVYSASHFAMCAEKN